MPQFTPGEVKSARAPITVLPSGLSCSTELYLVSNGAKVATSGIKLFTSTGVKQDIRLPITMPAEGTYPVWLDVFAEGLLIGAYKATEDVVIAAPAAPKFYMPAEMTVKVTNGTIFDMYHKCEFSCPITNLGNAIGTHTLWGRMDILGPFGPFPITLAPGETYTWSTWVHVDFSRVSAPYTVKLFGDWEADNYSKGEAWP